MHMQCGILFLHISDHNIYYHCSLLDWHILSFYYFKLERVGKANLSIGDQIQEWTLLAETDWRTGEGPRRRFDPLLLISFQKKGTLYRDKAMLA